MSDAARDFPVVCVGGYAFRISAINGAIVGAASICHAAAMTPSISPENAP